MGLPDSRAETAGDQGVLALRGIPGDESPDPGASWTPPPLTRWCLVGERGSPRLYLLTERGASSDPSVGLSPPVHTRHPDWLSPDGIGTCPKAGGIAGFVAFLTGELDRARAVRRAPRVR